MYLELFVSLTVISFLSLLGVFTLKTSNDTLAKWLDAMVAFAIGALLGDVFIHLLPELVKNGLSPLISFAILSGIIAFFILEKVIHWHHCHSTKHSGHHHRFTYMSLIGDALHNFIDGVILAGAFITSPVVGFSTAIAVFSHEVPHELGNFAILVKGGFSKKSALFYNFFSALTSFAGAILTIAFSTIVTGATPLVIAFAAGSFLYIAGTDLFPELHKEFSTKKAIIQIFFIILGVAAMACILLLE